MVAAESVAGNTRIGMFTRLILRKPFQVGRAAMPVSLVVSRPRDSWREATSNAGSRDAPPGSCAANHAVGDTRTIIGRSVAGLKEGEKSGRRHYHLGVPAPPARWRQSAASVRPMLATLADAPL